MADRTGIEPAISPVTGEHVNRYTTGPRWYWKIFPIVKPSIHLLSLGVYWAYQCQYLNKNKVNCPVYLDNYRIIL